MASLDTGNLWIPLLIVATIRGIFLFLQLDNPGFILVVVFYIVSIRSVMSLGKYFHFIFYGGIVDLFLTFFTRLDAGTTIVIIFIFPIIILMLVSRLVYVSIQKEIRLFERTILSFNDDDKIKARKAMITLNPIDISEVAKYRDWKHVP